MREWVCLTIVVSSIKEAVEVYVNKWKLFKIIIWVGEGKDENAILEAINPESFPFYFRLGIVLEGATDIHGNLRRNGKNVRYSFPKFDFWEWFDEVIGDESKIICTPWSASIHLEDPFGHICGVHTTRYKGQLD